MLQIQELGRALPIVQTLRSYKKSWFRHDLIAGVTVAAIAVPQAMAYANLAGAPLIAGLYAAMIAMAIFALFSSSKQVIVGPDAAMAALTGAAIIPLAHGNAGAAATLVAALAVLIGLACLAGLLARVGFIAEFLSRPILLGYMVGLALVVIASQIPSLFGLLPSGSINFFTTMQYVAENFEYANVAAIGISLILLSVGVGLQMFFPRVPVSLVILVGATAASAFFHFGSLGVPTVGAIPTGLPMPSFPSVGLNNLQSIIIPAMAIMAVSYANTIATARTFAAKQRERIDTTQEFMGLGLSNIAAGLFSGMPVAASGARTAVNHVSQAKTQVSQLFGAASIAIVLVALAPLLRYLPSCALAIIIIIAVSRLFDFAELQSIWHAWRTEALLAIATVIGVAVLGIMQGLLLAVFLAIANLIRQSALPYDAVLGVTENGSVHDMDRPPKTTTIPGLLMYRFDAPLYFANANFFRERVLHLIDTADEPVKWFLWDAETITLIDSTAGKMLVELIAELKRRKIVFAVARMKGSVRAVAKRSRHLSRALEHAPHYSSIGRAITGYKSVEADPSAPPPKERLIVDRTANTSTRYHLAQQKSSRHQP